MLEVKSQSWRLHPSPQETAHEYPGQGDVTFTVRCKVNEYEFFMAPAGVKGAEKVSLGAIDSRSLARTRTFDSQNTGTHFGLFAHGSDGESCMAPAFFSSVQLYGQRAGGP